MRRVTDRHGFFTVERVIFPKEKIQDSHCDLIRYMRFPQQREDCDDAISDIAYTYATDLTQDDETVLMTFSKTIRYEIRRSEKENITISYFDSQKLKNSAAVLADFKATYMHFCDVCGNQDLKRVFDADLIRKYIENECFLLSVAEFENGKVYHAYFFSDDSSCLWYSASDFRNPEVDRSLAARSNKRLHYEDMKYLRKNGILYYDWGNVSTKDNLNPNGIDRFKASFGGVYTEKYSYTVANTFLGRILVSGKRLLRKLKL